MMENFKSLYKEISVDKLNDLEKHLNNFEAQGQWIYRGQKDSNWTLKTSIDRMCEEFESKEISRRKCEIGLVKKFQREAHHYGISNMDLLNIPEWLTLMQHFGAPTRLLDWTHSPWVALFFAIIDLSKPTSKEHSHSCSLWATNWKEIDKSMPRKLIAIFRKDHNLINIDDFIETENLAGVIKLNSFKQNERQIIQQGTFLFPLNIENTFEENWAANLKKEVLIKINIPYKLKKQIIQKLHRMNISFATLYPGIEGFSKSLVHLHYIDNLLSIESGIENYSGYKKKFNTG